MNIDPEGSRYQIEAFAMILDINGFFSMVEKADIQPVGQFVADVLRSGISSVEQEDGSVVAFMGDAFLALLPTPDAVFRACTGIAKDIDNQCSYLSNVQSENPDAFPFALGGPSVKLAIEHGWIEVERITTAALGSQRLFIGPCINYAARIIRGGKGNRCILGPDAAGQLAAYGPEGPFSVAGKPGEPSFSYYELDLGDIWRAGEIKPGSDTYWD